MFDRTNLDALCTQFKEIGDKLSMELGKYRDHLNDRDDANAEDDNEMENVIDSVDNAVLAVADDIPNETEEPEGDGSEEQDEELEGADTVNDSI